MKRAAPLLLALAGLCCGAVQAAPPAPQENPAVDTLKAKKPAAKAAAKADAAPVADAGTIIVGDQDSDVGLYLTPWKEEHADNIDPPPGLFGEAPQAVDPRSFGRAVRDGVSVDAYRRQQMDPNR